MLGAHYTRATRLQGLRDFFHLGRSSVSTARIIAEELEATDH
jgi:hypothetical protein